MSERLDQKDDRQPGRKVSLERIAHSCAGANATRSVTVAVALLLTLAGCNTLFDTDDVHFDRDSVLDVPEDDAVDASDTPDSPDTAEPTDVADTTDAQDSDLTDDLGDSTDTQLDCTGQCGDGANCQACDGRCVDILSNAQHCGGCTADCTTLPNVDNVNCQAGECRIPTVNGCQPGYGNCDANVANGCERDTSADTQNCGSCGNTCNLVAIPPEQCVDGTCQ